MVSHACSLGLRALQSGSRSRLAVVNCLSACYIVIRVGVIKMPASWRADLTWWLSTLRHARLCHKPSRRLQDRVWQARAQESVMSVF